MASRRRGSGGGGGALLEEGALPSTGSRGYADAQERAQSSKVPPPVWLVHVGLIINQMAFGGGAVVGKAGLKHLHPIIFAFIRESLSGPLLCIAAWILERARPDLRRDWWRFLLCGLCLYGNQALFIVGLGLSTPVQASIWQPSQPIFTAVIASCIGWEKMDLQKGVGIALSVAGAAFMVSYGSTAADIWASASASICFFFNCLGTSLYVIFSKPLLKRYPALSVTGWSYIVASVGMGLTSLQYVHEAGAWHVPAGAWAALAYWVIMASIVAYFLMTWANQYADASIVSAYTTLQPLTSGVLQFVFLKKAPELRDLGGIGVLAGMLMVVCSKSGKRAHAPGVGTGEADSDGGGDDDGGEGGEGKRELRGAADDDGGSLGPGAPSAGAARKSQGDLEREPLVAGRA